MKFQLNLFLLFLIAFCSDLEAQKNLPVAGDAGILTDLLKRDYTTIDPALFIEEVTKDRALVISTFKSYLTESQRDSLDSMRTNVLTSKTYTYSLDRRTKTTTLQNAYSEEQKLAISLAKEKTVNQTALNEAIGKIELLKDSINSLKFKDDTMELSSLRRVYRQGNNTYLSEIISLFIHKYTLLKARNKSDSQARSNSNASLKKSIPFLGGEMGFEMIMEGLSKFIAQRIKEELSTAVIERIKEWLAHPKDSDPLAELKVLLPRTNAYLLSFNANQITNFTHEIKQYIEDDLNHILENIGGLRDTPRIKRLAANYPDVDFALEALELIPTLSKIKDPIDYFEILENSRNINRWKASTDIVRFNIANLLQLSSMLARSIVIIEDEQRRFAGPEFVGSYSADPNFYLLYVGFLRQQNLKYYNVHFHVRTANTVTLDIVNRPGGRGPQSMTITEIRYPIEASLDVLMQGFTRSRLENIRSDREFFESVFVQTGKDAEKVFHSVLDIRIANKKGYHIGADTIYSFIRNTINLAKQVTYAADTVVNFFLSRSMILSGKLEKIQIDSTSSRFTYTFATAPTRRDIPSLRLKTKTAPYFQVATTTNEMLFDLHQKKYATAIIKGLELTAKAMPEELNHSMRLLYALTDSFLISPKVISDKWQSEEWAKLLTALKSANSTTPVNIDKQMASAAKAIHSELEKIKDFYFANYAVNQTSVNMIGRLIEFAAELQIKGASTTFSVAGQLVSVQTLLTSPDFAYLVISYYANKRIDILGDELEKEMRDFTVMSGGKAVHLFTPGEAATLRTDLFIYVRAIYSYLQTHNEAALTIANKDFTKSAFAYLLRLPEKFQFKLNENTLKLIHFINDMAVAQNSEDVEKALEAFALPTGSYSIKRKTKSNLSITTLPGLLPAMELTWKNKVAYPGFSFAFTAPVGFNQVWGGCKNWSHGVFLSVIDLGALTRLHLSNEVSTDTTSTAVLPDFKFSNILAPGLYYTLGLPKLPITFVLGAQYGPGLREVNRDGSTKIYESMRFGIGVVLDIPLLNLYTKPRL